MLANYLFRHWSVRTSYMQLWHNKNKTRTYNPGGLGRRGFALHYGRHVIVHCCRADRQLVFLSLRLLFFPLYRTLGLRHNALGPHADRQTFLQPTLLAFPPHIHVHLTRMTKLANVYCIFCHTPPEESWKDRNMFLDYATTIKGKVFFVIYADQIRMTKIMSRIRDIVSTDKIM